jgi:uncharacterized protein
MNERTNTEIVQETYSAVGRNDIPAVLDLLTEDVEWILQGPSAIPFAGACHGKREVAEFFSLVAQHVDFEQFEPREFVAQGDTVVVLGYERNVMKATGKRFDQEWAHVYTLQEGRIATFRAFEDTGAYVSALEGSAASLT